MLHLTHLQISHNGYDYSCTLQGTLPHEGYQITYLCGTWNAYKFTIKIEIALFKKPKSTLPFPFLEKIALGPLRRGQYYLIVNDNEAWSKWFGVD
jgi:hypothetical protein